MTGIGLPVQAQVVGIAALAGDQPQVLLAADRLADTGCLSQPHSMFVLSNCSRAAAVKPKSARVVAVTARLADDGMMRARYSAIG